MIHLTQLPLERTTAASDLVLAVLAFLCTLSLIRNRRADAWKTGLWSSVFLTFGVAALLGAITHGFDLPENVTTVIWMPLYYLLGLAVANFIACVIYEIYGPVIARKSLFPLFAVSVIFFIVTQMYRDIFMVFVIYQASAVILATGVYSGIAIKRKKAGAWFMVAGLVVTLAAGIFQTMNSLVLTLIWDFDHNGIYHLTQMLGIVLLFSGLKSELPHS